MSAKIRVENLHGIQKVDYGRAFPEAETGRPTVRPFTVLFIKPWQHTRAGVCGPPLGILTLAAGLRRYFGEAINIHFMDMALYRQPPSYLRTRLDELTPDVVAISALNLEAHPSYELAAIAKSWNPDVLTVIGGPLTLRQAELVLGEGPFDWLFEGAADRTFLMALERYFSGSELGGDLPGFSYRRGDGSLCLNPGQDLIMDMDSLPLPAWDLLDFERYRYRDRNRMITNDGERRYAFLFTSRGCPYLCNYCHDLFTKRFVYRSEENVLEEMRILYENYGVREFHIIDDIFNLHRPRVQSLMRQIHARWKDIYIAFPNGLRGDILDEETIDAMVLGGTYHVAISIETVTPRLQDMVEKHLDIERAQWSIKAFARRGVIVQGAFMVGFPTETPEEIESTLRYAIHSPLTQVHFFTVIPQPQTPIYDQALREAPEVTVRQAREERSAGYDYPRPWYARAYGYDLEKKVARAYLRFYLHPPRLWRIVCLYSPRVLFAGGWSTLYRVLLGVGRRLVSLRDSVGSRGGPQPS